MCRSWVTTHLHLFLNWRPANCFRTYSHLDFTRGNKTQRVMKTCAPDSLLCVYHLAQTPSVYTYPSFFTCTCCSNSFNSSVFQGKRSLPQTVTLSINWHLQIWQTIIQTTHMSISHIYFSSLIQAHWSRDQRDWLLIMRSRVWFPGFP